MNIEVYKNLGTRVFGRGLLYVQKHSPEILTAVGIVGTVTAGVLAARATLKLEETVDHAQDRIDEARDGGTQADLVRAQAQAVGDVAKLYAPALFLGAASIGCIVGGHGILQKRNVALVAAYKTLETGYAKYRERVAEELGIEKDRDIHLGIRDEKVKDENGKTKTVKTLVDPNGRSVYARFFDELNPNWRPSAENNLYFLKAQQSYFNQTLQSRGHVFLNEVYDALGIERSQAGQMVGWVLSKNGDNYIDFGIYDVVTNPMAREFVNGNEAAIILDFNVDGVVFDQI